MRHVELESFLKSFALFFISLTLLAGTLFYFQFSKEQKAVDEDLLTQMRLCSFDLTCKRFSIDFVEREKQNLYTLQSDKTSYYSFFPISKSEQYLLKFSYTQENYTQAVKKIRDTLIREFLLVSLIIGILSTLFSLYALYPLRSALHLTREFVRDILHDFNTPLAALRLNVAMLKREVGENTKIERIEQGIETTLSLQENLRSYLEEHAQNPELFELHTLLESQIILLQKLYPHIHFNLDNHHLELFCNPYAFTRIIDNLLSNAAKYNKKEGKITCIIDTKKKQLIISDTGHGIKNPEKIFRRFYKEHTQGMGIGLHIVKKLCDEMKIPIYVRSKLREGSRFHLDLSKLTQH
ncbi:MAG: HAMP domain-containing sensor histidine kinase [Campylobacterota bacterium]|nr:HAMP domain-containing sensor histidine kinase [Campylobacterota bacterium]